MKSRGSYNCLDKPQILEDSKIWFGRIAEARNDQVLARDDIDALAAIAAGEESIFGESAGDARCGRRAGTIVGPESRTVRRAQR